MPKEDLVNFSVKISKRVAKNWYDTIIKNSIHPVRKRLEEALERDIEFHNGKNK